MSYDTPAMNTNSTAKDEDDVAAATESLRRAMLAADRAVLDRLCADALSYGHSVGRIETKEEFIGANIADPPVWKSISLTDQTVRVSGDTAVVRHTMSAQAQRDGKVSAVKIGVLLIWQKQAALWKLLARQAVKL